MLQLRSFVHQRLSSAAEEILGEVEKVIALALYEADGQRLKLEPDVQQPEPSSPQQISEPPLTTSTLNEEEEPQGASPQPLTQEELNLSEEEVPGPSQTTEERRFVQIDFGIRIKQEESAHDIQTEEIVYPTVEAVNKEQDLIVDEVYAEMQPVSSDNSEAESNNEGSDEEWSQNRGAQNNLKRPKPDGSSSRRGRKELRVCPVCGKGFKYIPPFMEHLKKHELNESISELLNNLKRCHNKTYCDICGKTLSSTSALSLHSKIHAGIKDFKCQHCEKTFVCKGNLKTHLKTHFKKGSFHSNNTTVCGICGKKFSTPATLKLHSKIHAEIKDFKCQYCGKSFCQKGNLKLHLKTHSEERAGHPNEETVCDICDKDFATPFSLKLHSKIHTGIKDFRCHHCGKLFCRKGNLKLHLKTHLEETSDRTNKAPTCEICGKELASTTSLKMHLKIHAGIRDFTCQVCGKSFYQKGNLKSHLKTHSRGRWYRSQQN
ncbi:zinc finger protein OZF-like [Cheilinus undulatus]|uniref:zinc finger protein OZF-like n=1 Tax=Cheilinus undulatus TaxID=241271 RepID=UPI001BD61714|nr:zinc finger protein OZF-like [Cheilinus undulatus]